MLLNLSLFSGKSSGADLKQPLTKSTSLIKLFSIVFIFSLFFLFPESAFAAGGLEKANKLLETVIEWLNYLSIAVVTIAILVVGYKITFGGQTIQSCAPIIIGAIVIVSAAQIANLLMG